MLAPRGVSTTGLWGEALVTRALGPLGSLHSTSDFPLIINDVIGRTLRESYAAAPSGIRQIARESTAPDFRTRARIMLDSSGFLLEKVSEHGEFKSGTIAEAAEAYKIDTYGRIFGITRQALINDDLGAFTDLTRRLGLAAAAFEAQFLVDLIEKNDGAWPKMSDQKNLFDPDHHNIVVPDGTWPPGNPSVEWLSAARLALRTQTSSGGALINLTPRWLLAPAALETQAEKPVIVHTTNSCAPLPISRTRSPAAGRAISRFG